MPRALVEKTFGSALPFNEWAGIDYLEASRQQARLHMPYAARLSDGAGAPAEGALLVLADVTGGIAAIAAFEGAFQVATSTLQMSHVAPVPPGCDVVSEGHVVGRDAHTVLVDVVLRTADAAATVLRHARVRLITSRQVDGKAQPAVSAALPGQPAPPAEAPSLSAALAVEIAPAADGLVRARVPFRPFLLGNASRQAIHGGGVASAMVEALTALPVFNQGRPLVLDSTTDYVRPALGHDMEVVTEIRRAGGRYVFADARVEQVWPDAGRTTVAYTRATLGRLQATAAGPLQS